MFYEFAVDPDLVTLWCDREGYAGFLKQFGIERKRIVSKFPKDWVRHVEESFANSYPQPSIQQSLRKTEIISILKKQMVKRGSGNYAREKAWLENAENEHDIRPFKGILAISNPRNSSSVTILGNAEDVLMKLDEFPSSCDAERTSDALVAPIAPMLRCCEYAIFVDPYFDTSPRFTEPFKKSLQILANERYGSSSPKVELHTSIERCFGPRVPRDANLETREAKEIVNKFQNKLPEIIPRGLTVKVVIWKERLRGQKLHNRYLLTDIGSVSFGTGLDCNHESFHRIEPQGQSDDISCLSADAHNKRWSEYVSSPAFEQAFPHANIPGKTD